MVPWSHWRQPFSGWMLTVRTSELTHFNLVIRLSNVQQLALLFCTILRCPAVPVVPGTPVICSFMCSYAEHSETSVFTAASAFVMRHDMQDNRQQACPLPAGVVSLVFGEVKHIVHPIRWNLKAVLCQLWQDLTACLEWLNARLLGLGTESFLWNFQHRFFFLSLYLSNVPVDNLADVMAYSAAASTCFFDVATINAECTFIWTTFAIASYMVFVVFTHAACFSHTNPCHSHHWLQLLMQYQLPTSCLQWPHPWFLKPPWCTPLHRLSLLPRHPLLQPHGTLLQLHPMHRLPHRHHCRAHRTHLVPFILHRWPKHLRFLQMNLDNLQSRPPRSFAPTRNLTNYAVQLQKLSLPVTPPEPTTAPSPPISPELAALGSTTQQLAESVRFIQAQQQMILDSQRAQEQRQQLLHQDLPYNWPHTAYTITYIGTTHNNASTCTESETHWTWSSGPHHRLDSSRPSSSPSTSTNIAITPTTIQDSKITLPSTIHTTASSTTFPSPYGSTLFSPSSISFFDQKHDKDRRTPSPYRRRSPPDGAHQLLIDVIDLIPDHAPELLVAIPEAVKSYYEPATRPSNPTSFPHLMLMTPGANGTTVTILTTTITAQIDPDLLRDHHHLIHHQTHQHTQQHHLEPWPSVSRTVTAKTQMQPKHFQSQNSTRMTSNSANLLRRPMIHFVYDAWPSLTQTIQYLSAQHWTNPIKLLFNNSWTKCSTSWLNHIAPSTTNLFSSKQAKPPSWTLPGLCTIQTTWHRSGKENTGLLCRTREPADHHGANGLPKKTDLSWRTRGHLPDLPQNELGNSCQDPCWRLHSPGNLDKKRGRLSDSIPMLRILRHVLWDSWHRRPTRLCRQVMYIPALPHREKDKTHLAFWPFVALPNACVPYPGGNDQIQRLCNLQGISKAKTMQRLLTPVLHQYATLPLLIRFPRIDHTHTAPETRPPTAAAPSEPPDNTPADRELPARPNPALIYLHLQIHHQTTPERQPPTTRPPNIPHQIMLADIGTTTLLGTVQRIPVETVVHPIVKVTLEINIAKAKLDPALRHTTTPDLAGKPLHHWGVPGNLMITPRPWSSEPSGPDRFFWSNNASPDIRYLSHFFRQKIYELLPAHRLRFVFTWCFTHLGRIYHVSHISDRAISSYHLFTPTADFSWLIALISTYLFRGYCLHHGVPRPDLSV